MICIASAGILSSSLTQHTKRFVVSQSIADIRFIGWKVQHNNTLIPIGSIGCPVGNLPKKIKVRFSEFNVDATSIGRCHELEFLGLCIEQLTNPFQHCIGLRNRKREFKCISVNTVLPHRLLVGIQTTDKNIIIPSVDGPFGDGFVSCLFLKVGVFPLSEKYFLGEEIR